MPLLRWAAGAPRPGACPAAAQPPPPAPAPPSAAAADSETRQQVAKYVEACLKKLFDAKQISKEEYK